jgi:hypothetical protein
MLCAMRSAPTTGPPAAIASWATAASQLQARLRAVWTPGAISAALTLFSADALGLALLGRRAWCACGSLALWWSDVASAHNSQHLFDPYSFTHALHGLLLYAALRLALGQRWPAQRLLLALAAEVGWEVLENTDAVINAYRQSTVSLGYYGDSIANSLGDVLACAAGYTAAALAPAWLCALTFAAVEVALLATIRDSLLLNVLMLLHPIAALKQWQLGH